MCRENPTKDCIKLRWGIRLNVLDDRRQAIGGDGTVAHRQGKRSWRLPERGEFAGLLRVLQK
jgi:hypothetical protein